MPFLRRSRRRRVNCAPVAFLAILLLAPLVARAGGGPENVFVVVNRLSWASQTVANHFIQLRQIPAYNVFYVDWDGNNERTDIDTFRQKILIPILTTLTRRHIDNQIDYIIYSTDLPFLIDGTPEFKDRPMPAVLAPVGSITGLTYLAGFVSQKHPGWVSPTNNEYMRRVSPTVEAGGFGTAHGFRSAYGWGSNGEVSPTGIHYVLSTMIAYTSGRGNSVREAIDYLRRSAAADGTHPKGTIYFMRTSDEKRSAPRQNGFYDVADALVKQGVAAVVEQGSIPIKRNDVVGLMTGLREFDWAGSGSTILPGAICDDLTSYGGALEETGGQTPLTEFLRFGAAGASGTIYEPMAVAEKFPAPAMQLHYARGCTLAESFYQAVRGPYQLLIVGDPLCRPWANIPQVTVSGLTDGAKVSGAVKIIPSATVPGGSVKRFELFVDGLRIASCADGEELTLETTKFSDGYHDVRIVGIEAGRIETQGRQILGVEFDNQHQEVTLTAAPAGSVRWGQKLTLSVKAPGATSIAIFQNDQLLSRFGGEAGDLELDSRVLKGNGPIRLRAYSLGANSAALATSKPLDIQVEAAEPLPSQATSFALQLGEGLKLTLPDKKVVIIQDTSKANWLSEAGVKSGDEYTLSAYFDVPIDDVYQFQLRHGGDLRLSVDEIAQYQLDGGNKDAWRYVPISLAKGRHRLDIQGKAGADLLLELKFGGPGAYSVRGYRFKHVQ